MSVTQFQIGFYSVLILENKSQTEFELPATLFVLVFSKTIRIQIAVRSAAINVIQHIEYRGAELYFGLFIDKSETEILEETGIPVFLKFAAKHIASETSEFRTCSDH